MARSQLVSPGTSVHVGVGACDANPMAAHRLAALLQVIHSSFPVPAFHLKDLTSWPNPQFKRRRADQLPTPPQALISAARTVPSSGSSTLPRRPSIAVS